MALVRTVTVGFRGAGGKLEKVEDQVPADWLSGDGDAMEEVKTNKKLRTRIAVDPNAVIYAKIGDPWDPDKHVYAF